MKKATTTRTAEQQHTVAKMLVNGWVHVENTDLGSVLLRKGNKETCVYWDGSKIEYTAGRA